MLKDITLGQYYTADSVIHRLDPRVKLVATLFFIIAIFVANDPVGFCFITICLFGVIALSKVPFSYMVRGLKSIINLLLISSPVTLVYHDREMTPSIASSTHELNNL